MKKLILALVSLCYLTASLSAQEKTLTLEQTVALASDSALQAFKNKNMYLAGYWEYRSFKANRLPSVNLSLVPAAYNRGFVTRYDSQSDVDFYGVQRSYAANGTLSIEQNLDLLGGKFFIESGLQYLRYLGDNPMNQFSSMPFNIGYRQDLIGYNPFRWEKKIEPVKYEKAKKEYLYNTEQISEEVTSYFFTLAMAQEEFELAKKNKASADTLLTIGQKKFDLTSITTDELYTLELEKINAENTLRNASLNLKRAMHSLVTYLNIDPDTQIRLILPTCGHTFFLPIEDALAKAQENNPVYLTNRQSILEAKQNLDKKKRESLFQASFEASVGFSQAAESFSSSFSNLMRSEMVSISLQIPILDWGVRKGQYRMAKNNLNVIEISSKQSEISVEKEVIMAVNDFNLQQKLIENASYALDLAEKAYQLTMSRFMEGTTDMNTMTLASNRKDAATKNYIISLQSYWQSYYKIRRLTLYDFVKGISLSNEFDFNLNTI